MAFGITRDELNDWKRRVAEGQIAFLTHYWYEPRFPEIKTVTKVGCSDLAELRSWCIKNGLNPDYIHHRDEYPHYDLIGSKQKDILIQEQLSEHIRRFGI
ncbi:hypothetical protein GCM10023310_38390 [Paenibacillus vulneris]|uniref:YneQ n=1 Tax=Paenibacillus vulneris TaxID=1133364 RepID=A0ABW3ULW6_9BACL|nr:MULTISPECIES: hypothetical protein [unclassified Paenibacillus]MBE1444964.1 hypothetical protein [Paenibacillus sp. OAS669]